MTQEEFINVFAESFDDELGDINLSTKYKELDDWTSMQALILIAHLDDTINVVLSADDIRNSQSLGDLFEIVKRKM